MPCHIPQTRPTPPEDGAPRMRVHGKGERRSLWGGKEWGARWGRACSRGHCGSEWGAGGCGVGSRGEGGRGGKGGGDRGCKGYWSGSGQGGRGSHWSRQGRCQGRHNCGAGASCGGSLLAAHCWAPCVSSSANILRCGAHAAFQAGQLVGPGWVGMYMWRIVRSNTLLVGPVDQQRLQLPIWSYLILLTFACPCPCSFRPQPASARSASLCCHCGAQARDRRQGEGEGSWVEGPLLKHMLFPIGTFMRPCYRPTTP